MVSLDILHGHDQVGYTRRVMILFLHGPDTYRSRQRLSVLKKAFQQKYDPSGQSIVTLDGATLTVEAFRQALQTAGLFTKRRLVIIEELIGHTAKRNNAEAISGALLELRMPPEYVLIFWEGAPGPKDNPKLHKQLEKSADKVEAFPLLTGAKLVQWIQATVRELGSKIDPQAVDVLTRVVNNDLWRMRHELEKLTALAADRPITADDIGTLVVQPDADAKVYELTDALLSRNIGRAAQLLDLLLHNDVHPLALIQVIARQLTQLVSVQEVMRDAPNPATVARRLDLKPFVAQRAVGQAKRFTADELISLHDRLVQLDLKMKTTRLDPRALLLDYLLRT